MTAAIDCLSRDTTDSIIITCAIQRAGAGLKSLAEPLLDTTSDFAGVVLAVLRIAAKFERRRIKEDTAIGHARATAADVNLDCKPKRTPHRQREAIRRRDKGEQTLPEITRSDNV